MPQEQTSENIEAQVAGDVSGQIAVGRDIHQRQTIGIPRPVVTPEEQVVLRAVLDQLKAQVVAVAAPELQQSASERVQELDEAVSADPPDLNTIQYVRGWIGRHLPQLAGSITSLVFHPVLGKLVEAAGDLLTDEFRRRFGRPPPL
jgi:hypothetical protein